MKKNPVKPDRSSSETPLAIIGIGCLFPQANDPSAYWANIREGIDAITDIPATHWRTEDYYAQDQKTPDHTYGQRGGFISPVPFNPMEFNIPPNIIEAIDTSQLLGLVAAGHALKDAGYGPERDYDRSRASVILGVTGTLELVIPLGARLGHPIWRAALKEAGVDEQVAEDVVERIADSYVPWQENSFPGLLGNVVAGRISKQYDLGGTNCVVDAACASSFSALHLAGMELATGKADMVVTGGIDTFNDIFMYMCFSKTPALSPSGNAKPFDASADGTILGEGLGIVVIKRLADAERDGDNIYAVIRGIGSSSDGKGDAIYAPNAGGQKKALLDAYKRAGVTPESIGMIEAHGTGTKVGDAVEVSALREVYGEASAPWCSLGSVKSQIGHTKAAAGAAGLIKAALALHHKVIPPTIKVQTPQAEITSGNTPFYLTNRKRPWLAQRCAPRRAAVSAFGFGGSNFHVVLEEYQSAKENTEWDGAIQILSFSGAGPRELETALAGLPLEGSWNEIRNLAAASRAAFNSTAHCRLALVIEQGRGNFSALVNNALAMLAKNPDSSWNTPDGAFFACGACPGKLGVLFPGQGSQYTGMLNDLACQFPQLIDTLAAANEGFDSPDNRQLSDLIYPISAFDADTAALQETTLRATETAQPAIGATSLGALKILQESFDLAPDAAAGHSYGELTALCAAGRINETALHSLSRLRGSLMGKGNGDKGSMLAVSASLAVVEQVLAEENLDLVIANRNAPSQAVLSGASHEIERAAALFAGRKLSCKQLPVAAAFHSSLVADAAAPFLEALQEIEFSAAQIPVYANTTAAEYPSGADAAKALLAGQLARPVEFVAEIEAMYAAGVHSFLEVGPGSRLTGLVKSILGNRDHAAVAIDASAGKRSGIADLARALAQLAVLGHGIRLNSWDDSFQPASHNGKKPAMTVPICGANYVKPKPKRPPVEKKQAAITSARTAVAKPAPAVHLAAATTLSSPDALGEALRVTQQNMSLLQKMQEETAQLHRRFLENQEAADRTFKTLLDHQQRLIHGTSGTVSIPDPAPYITRTLTPAPVTQAAAPLNAPVPVVMDNAAETLLNVVSEKTGYPLEMLELDMGMDSDLGIDSIKRVEILSALQERLPGSPIIGPEQIGTLRTLGEIAAHLSSGNTTPAALTTATPATSATNVTEALLGVVSEKTGYPVEMLELDMGMDSDLGIDSIKRVEILSALQERLPGSPIIGPEHLGTLRTLGEIAAHLSSGNTTPAALTTATPATSATNVTEALLGVVSEKTGYPVEMLELDMGMDSDLGIDSIKRVEILSALQERLPGSPIIGPEQIGTLRTLGEIAAHLSSGNTSPAALTTATPATSAANVTEALLGVVSEKTGYPVEMLELDMGMDSDLGIDSIKRVEILSALQERLPGSPIIGPEQIGTLRTLGEIAHYLAGANTREQQQAETSRQAEPDVPPATSIPAITRSAVVAVPLDEAAAWDDIKVANNGEFWVADDGSTFTTELCAMLLTRGLTVRTVAADETAEISPPKDISGLIIVAPAAGTDDLFLEKAFLLLKNAAPALRQTAASGNALFVTVSRLDGSFGCGAASDLVDPLSGGLAGLSKTASREWPEVICKAIDQGGFSDPAAAAQAVADEIFRSGPSEVGLTPEGRFTLTLSELPAAAVPATAPILKGDVVVITGGGRGVTAATAVALTEAYQPLLVLLGRSPEPASEPDWLAPLNDAARIKRALLEQAGGKLHPREIEQRYQAVLAGRELTATLDRITAAGGEALYRSVDIRDADAVSTLLAGIRREHGPIRGIVHGAGVLADRLIIDKSRDKFTQVYSTKVAGLRSLLAATAKDELSFIALFSSTTGRFGRTGQVDYAVANEVLNKLAQYEARRHPACRAVSINWGPWDGGMVTPALKKVFAGEGIGLIDLMAGGEFLVREIAATDAAVEIVAIAGTAEMRASANVHTPAKPLTEALSLSLSVSDYPFLRSHVLDGKAVLPMAVIVEWLAHGALHGNPGFRFHGFNDLRICKGVVFEQNTRYTLRIMAGRSERRESFHMVPVELVSTGKDGRSILHARAEIVLTTKIPAGIRSITEIPTSPYAPGNDALYNHERLFHGPDLHGIEHVDGYSAKGIAALVKSAPQPAKWIKQPLRSSWLTDPLVIDSAFQLMILWSFERFGSGSLPCFAGRYRQFQETFPKEGVHVVIRVTVEREQSATADMEFLDRTTGKLVARLEGYECIIDPSLKKAFQRNQLPQTECSVLGAA